MPVVESRDRSIVGVDEIWPTFSQELEACGARLLAELHAASSTLTSLVQAQHERLGAIPPRLPPHTLDEVETVYAELLPALVVSPLEVHDRRVPLQRALTASDDYDRSLEQLIRGLPEMLTGAGSQWIASLGAARFGPLAGTRVRLRRELRVSTRSTLLLALAEHRAQRRAIEGRFLVALGELSLEVLAPWHAARRLWLSSIERVEDTPATEVARLAQRSARHADRASRTLSEIKHCLSDLTTIVARRLRVGPQQALSRLETLTARDDQCRSLLGRQARAIDADLHLDLSLARAEEHLVHLAQRAQTSIEEERRALVGELDTVVEWLERAAPGADDPFPPSTAAIVSRTARLRAWTEAADAPLRDIPQAVELSSRLVARPGLLSAFTLQSPRATARESLDAVAAPLIREALEAVEQQHRGIVLEIERAREVIAFARDLARSAASVDPRIEREGIENAKALLQFHRQQLRQQPSPVEGALVAGLVRAGERTTVALKEGQFGLVTQAARNGLPRTMHVLWRRGKTRARLLLDRAWQWGGEIFRAALVRVGWTATPLMAGPHVVTRRSLTRALGGESRTERLPLIYQRLFSLSPLEDPRFLVGRDDELQALTEARRQWEQGRDTAVLFVGERGSGKTSLINCAAQRVFTGIETVRSDFGERLTTPDQMYAFLSAMIGVAPEHLESTLATTRRLIILEEVERTFLRKTNGYEAIRSLLNLISRTSKKNLWILSLNASCFRLLNAALRLEPHFSHRINAMAVEQAHLREAILMRHGLSGLRLRFAPPAGHGYTGRALRAAVPADPEDEFFSALYRESGGVFRSAFALWQRYIDRAEGGVLYMRRPTRPESEAIVESLDVLDLFTLSAILQHGSLTPHEHSTVFQIDDTRSRAWLDNLLARELIEPDPGRQGFRVVPDASQIVREALFRRNVG